MQNKDNEVNFFNNDFDSSIASSFTANNSGNGTGGLQSASFLFGSEDSTPVPSSLSVSSIPSSSSTLLDSSERALIPPSSSLPILSSNLRPGLPPVARTWTPHAHAYQNGESFTAPYGGKDGMELDSCDPIEREYLLEAKREQEGPANIETDLINLDYSFKSEELKRGTGVRLPGHTSSSNTPNSSSSSGVKTPNLLPASVPTLSHEQPPYTGQMDLSHSHETVCNEPVYTADNKLSELSSQFTHNQQLNLSGEQTHYQQRYNPMEHNYIQLQTATSHTSAPLMYPQREQHINTHNNQVVIPANSRAETYIATTKATLYMQEHSNAPITATSSAPHNIQPYSTTHSHTQSNPLPVPTAQLQSLLTEQRLTAPTKQFPAPYSSAFLRPASSNTASIFPPLNPPKHTPAPLPPGDQNDLEVQRASSNAREVSRSELSVGASDPDENLPRCSSALETRFTPVPPPKQRKKTKSSSKRRVSNARDTCDTGSDQDRQSSSGGAVPMARTSSYTSLAPRPSSRTSEPARRSRPFSAIPKPPQITTEIPIPGAHTESLKTSPPPQLSSDPAHGAERLRELPPVPVPDTHVPRYLPQPPKAYTDPNLTMPVGTDYPYPPYGYPPIPRWPGPPEEDPGAGYPPQGYFPFYNPYQYPYMYYPPYVPNGDTAEEQQQLMPPGYPPYPFPYYPMPPPMYHCISHPGSRMSSYAPSLADDTTEIGSLYGAEDAASVTSQQQSTFLMEQLTAQPISFENFNHSSTPVPELEPQRETPLLFDYPHAKAAFSRNGALLLTPYPSASGVMIHRLHELCQLPLLAGHASFPGPLDSLSVKSEVVRFSQEHVTASQRQGDTDGAFMWEYLSRLCAQNGVLVTSDVVELLTQGGSFSMRQIESHPPPQGLMERQQAGEQLRLLVLQRRIKDAVEFCTAQQMWTHALLLAQTLDEHSRASVQDRFTYSLHASDPLQCYYSAVVGKRPHGVHAFYLREGHSWKQHLAILISHRHLASSETSISSLADNLAECAHTSASHLVRLLQGHPLGGWGDRESRYALLGTEGSGLQVSSRRVGAEELHKTEVYEYARSLSNSEFSLPGFQPFKYQLAVLYTEAGLLQKALSYCEAIFVSVQKQPCSYSLGFLSLLLSLSDRLHGSLVPLPSTPVRAPPHYPRWISVLSSFIEQQQGGCIYVPTPSLPLLTPTPSLLSPYPQTAPQFGVGPLSAPGYVRPQATQPHPTAPIPFSEPDAGPYRDGFVVGSPEDDEATTESYKSAGDESLMGGGGHNTDEEVLDFDLPSLDSSPLPPGMISGPQSPSESINRSAGSNDGADTGGFYGIVGSLVGRIRSKSLNRNQMRLPKSERFFYDYDKGMWIDKEGGEQESAAPMSPPKDIDLRPLSNIGALPPVEPQGIMSSNPRSRYVDVFNTTGAKPSAPVPLFPSNFDSPFSGTLFIPQNQQDPTAARPAPVQGRVSPDTVSVTTASISEASKEVRQILQNRQHLSNPLPPGMRY